MADNNNLIMQYQEQSILTMSRGELLIKLYDELLKNLKYASVLLGQKQSESAQKYTSKAKDIVNYLYAILDDKYSISANLKQIYSHLLGQIIKANVSGDPSFLDGVVPTVQELRDAWAQAEKATRMQNGSKRAAL
ncbi:Flagellar secretion chaperone FliS [Caprobacter fermentans]|uniref:Flagellar export chaperone FliS n=1 Tax=Caproicibacter fermentans TaxID=2576756 RepID=A0A6N8HVD8_9FIRM|nr:flagellar export chaperone FliS [Caproicibacter fermentans]MVB09761.1 Flagellar secretion chaperone FliS [Caproicibacter fermentans]OCN03166.1 flagellar export chaperone FliS [Clostridium sp. W14A]QNK42357.1 flagellar export chaperone FliS [Caproicibacter fermentans]